ncbi:hypothetical protein [Paludifilum halophilum]|uniref:Uncharacterized protein n=1 Tax=Paludifilum halophilum TaxID=1642702 RepID=A0A235B2K4_9BACL|nr:hypothetical protein [Paludifilum halophilum]OYD06137.1 hypothetical protein CHM34_17945 [Paludifilum halophilum]
MLKLLNILESGLNRSHPHLKTFKQVAQTIIDRQREIELTVNKGEKYIEGITYKKVNIRDREELASLQIQLLRCSYEQNHVQLETYHERQELIRWAQKNIPIWNIRLWLAYFELKTYHQRMLSKYKLSLEEIRDKRVVEDRIAGQPDPDDEKTFREIISKTINPKG